MNEKKLMQLSGMVGAVIANLEFQQQQLQVAQQPLLANSQAVQTNIANITSNLTAIAAGTQPLNKTDIEVLAKLKSTLQKISHEISKELERPILQFKKDLDQNQVSLREKIGKELIKPSTFNLDPLRKSVTKAQDMVQKNSLVIDKLLAALGTCQSKLAQAEAQMHRLNLPNEITATTKELAKLTKDLGSLQSHLAENPKAKDLYQAQFLPLYDALEKLRIQTATLAPASGAIKVSLAGP